MGACQQLSPLSIEITCMTYIVQEKRSRLTDILSVTLSTNLYMHTRGCPDLYHRNNANKISCKIIHSAIWCKMFISEIVLSLMKITKYYIVMPFVKKRDTNSQKKILFYSIPFYERNMINSKHSRSNNAMTITLVLWFWLYLFIN